ncbi:MAG TPA: calcium-binding protein [Rhodocyclaceae bacterium]|nr:calcium-binding protein [Rhodocyclaceae bacterium]
MLQGRAWNGDALLLSYLRSQPPSAELQALLAENGIRIKGHAGWSGDGDGGDDIVVGDAADDTLYGNGGDDILDGNGGQDLLVGGAGSDTYLFRRSSGHDRINAYDTTQERIETLVLDGLNVGDIRAEKWGDYDLAFVVKDSGESIVVQNFFSSEERKLDFVKFADGATWDRETIQGNFGGYSNPQRRKRADPSRQRRFLRSVENCLQ